MRGKKNNTSNKKNSLIILILLVIIVILSIIIGNIIRSKRINKQAIENINTQDMVTTIFCSGKNVKLTDSTYDTLKEKNVDLVISNDKYVAKVQNENINQNIDLQITTKKDKVNDNYSVVINSEGVVELKVKLKGYENDYISEFANEELLTNEAVVTPEGYVEIELKDNVQEYKLDYIVPEDFTFEDFSVNKGASKTVDLKLEEKDYTYGSVKIECEDNEAVTVDHFKVTGNTVGEYKIYAKTDSVTKEATLKVEQSVEKIELSSLTIELAVDNQTDVTAKITPEDAVNKELEWKSSDENIATVDNGTIKGISEGNCEIIVSTKEEPIVSTKLQVEVKKKVMSISQTYPAYTGQVEGITYINGIMLVNKTHSVPQDYAPGLQTVAYNAFLDLSAAAAAEGYDISLLSGYRSYETQKRLYNNYVATYGQAEADTFSAKPGTSEHQTGLAMDVGWIDDSYGDTPSGKWLAANCYKYGFIIRYPKDKESITGYKYEPWHIRYLGTDIAKDVYESGLCLEEYLGVN